IDESAKLPSLSESPKSTDSVTEKLSLESLLQAKAAGAAKSTASPVMPTAITMRERASTMTELEKTRARLRELRRQSSLSLSPETKHTRTLSNELDRIADSRRRSTSTSPSGFVRPLRVMHTSEDLRANASLWEAAAHRRGSDPEVAGALEHLTRLRAEIAILEKTVLQGSRSPSRLTTDGESDSGSVINEPSTGVQTKMRMVLARKRKEYADRMRKLGQHCGHPLDMSA
ncbi:hypothetical protein THASP1DRAFT_31405, partial [Thamnocephalis sphaerospora]